MPPPHCMNLTLEVATSNSGTAITRHRATVCLWVESIEQKVEYTAWLTAWKKKMTYVSNDYGCGCCFHLFDVEGPKAAIDAIPKDLLVVSAWTENGLSQVSRHLLSRETAGGVSA